MYRYIDNYQYQFRCDGIVNTHCALRRVCYINCNYACSKPDADLTSVSQTLCSHSLVTIILNSMPYVLYLDIILPQ